MKVEEWVTDLKKSVRYPGVTLENKLSVFEHIESVSDNKWQ